MNAEEKKAWEERVELAKRGRCDISIHCETILAADAELTRLRSIEARCGDVEGIITLISLSGDPEVAARAVSRWLKEGK